MRAVRVHYCGQLGIAAGRGHAEIPVEDGVTIGDFVRALAERTGGEFARLVLDGEGKLRSTLLVAVDGEQVADFARAIEGNVREVTLLPPIAGG
jgi:molybdopterin converting factor small subunit